MLNEHTIYISGMEGDKNIRERHHVVCSLDSALDIAHRLLSKIDGLALVSDDKKYVTLGREKPLTKEEQEDIIGRIDDKYDHMGTFGNSNIPAGFNSEGKRT